MITRLWVWLCRIIFRDDVKIFPHHFDRPTSQYLMSAEDVERSIVQARIDYAHRRRDLESSWQQDLQQLSDNYLEEMQRLERDKEWAESLRKAGMLNKNGPS